MVTCPERGRLRGLHYRQLVGSWIEEYRRGGGESKPDIPHLRLDRGTRRSCKESPGRPLKNRSHGLLTWGATGSLLQPRAICEIVQFGCPLCCAHFSIRTLQYHLPAGRGCYQTGADVTRCR